MDRDWLTPEEVAAKIQIHPATVRDWVRKGEIKAHRIGTRIRIYPRDIQHLLHGEPTPERRTA